MTSAAPDPAPPSLELRRAPEPALGGRISANTLYLLLACGRRLWLARHRPDLAAPPGDFDLLIREKGSAHERQVREGRFARAAGPVYVSGQPPERAAEETLRLLREGAAALYQPFFRSRDGRRVGVPDFVYREGGGLVVHDAKLAVNLGSHPEIGLQLAHYARLIEDALGARPARLEITNGDGEVLPVEDPGDETYDEALRQAAALVADVPEPRVLRTHSVCADCAFYEHCWPQAVAEDRIEILRDVTRSVAVKLHGLGIHAVTRLAAARPEDIRVKGIAGSAEAIVAEARAHRDRRPVWLGPPQLPPWPIVWFDLEGDPEGEEVDQAIYLWGLAVDDGRGEPATEAITADFGDQGGRRAWERFVARAGELLERHPDARWVHYSPYEKTWVRHYAATYGAPAGLPRAHGGGVLRPAPPGRAALRAAAAVLLLGQAGGGARRLPLAEPRLGPGLVHRPVPEGAGERRPCRARAHPAGDRGLQRRRPAGDAGRVALDARAGTEGSTAGRGNGQQRTGSARTACGAGACLDFPPHRP